MKKVFLIVSALIVCTSFSFAADFEAESFDVYSFDPVTNSALDYAVSPLAVADWSTNDSNNLLAIRNALVYASTIGDGSVFGWIQLIGNTFKDGLFSDILTELEEISRGTVGTSASLLWYTREIYNDLSSVNSYSEYLPNLTYLQTIDQDTGFLLSDVGSILSGLGSLYDLTRRALVYGTDDYPYLAHFMDLYNYHAQYGLVAGLIRPALPDGSITLYGMVQLLQETLASEDDRLLAESQKQNRVEIEDSFLNGSSGSTSLGASDFGDLSDVGGTVKDSISLNGQASVSSFTSGLAGADESGQGWFSAATRDSLDSVSGSVSTFSLDDPYNMSGWYDRYSWVEGD